jgi:N-acetylneuraminic acid mutarotase
MKMSRINYQDNQSRQLLGLALTVAILTSVFAVTSYSGTRAHSSLKPAGLSSSPVVGPSWSYTGSLNQARYSHTATRLPNGKVLVAGGYAGNSYLSSAELYDPITGTWSSTGNLNAARAGHTATLLQNGKVLIVGDNSAELYDPATGMWSVTGNLNAARSSHTATLLPNGKVLVAGGGYGGNGYLNSAELYDPATATWSNTGSLNTDRFNHTATLLSNGKVLVAGGRRAGLELNSAELYDPATGTWSITGNLNAAREYHTATLLPNGKVLVTGAYDGLSVLNSAELYDPATGTWSYTGNLNTGRYRHTATLLPNGSVIVAAGSWCDFIFGCFPLIGADLYDPTTGTWSGTASLNTARAFGHTATLLLNGKVLVAGGGDGDSNNNALNTAELYDPGPNQIDDAQFFVRQQYLDFLNREPEPGGLAYWTDQITQCGNDALCVHNRRIDVSAEFFLSLEFQQTGSFVYGLYKGALGRQPTYPEFTADHNRVIGGADLEAEKAALANDFVQRPEFQQHYPGSMTNTQFVNTLFDTASLFPFTAERQAEIDAMNSQGRTRAQVLRNVIDIQAFRDREFNPSFVLMQYFGYTRRDIDQGGYAYWLDVLNRTNNYRGMVCNFINSWEYQLRFGAVTSINADCSQ